ncbi:shikimate kinase [Paenibacillus soyae]|uniref:Shikimate kinase n=1 Tax=Paenibacillus soyae TaxID=2969249 RepID=A0A9X2MSD0_9BACL|nr:shikimate kinase [Paenibacillus soyae]MCR2804871.1 shikimate kinase [Paenibacillus soyae]
MVSQASRDKLILIGFMGTGKSSVSRLLADKLGWLRLDADEEIERAEGRTIPEIFASDGEEAFRAIESRVLAGLINRKEPIVIATGGGAVLREENREAMLGGGFVVALACSAERIIARVKADTERPLLQGDVESRVHALLEQRKGIYDFAHFSIDTTELTVEQVVENVLREWKLHFN